jgi:hypothetical protein
MPSEFASRGAFSISAPPQPARPASASFPLNCHPCFDLNSLCWTDKKSRLLKEDVVRGTILSEALSKTNIKPSAHTVVRTTDAKGQNMGTWVRTSKPRLLRGQGQTVAFGIRENAKCHSLTPKDTKITSRGPRFTPYTGTGNELSNNW